MSYKLKKSLPLLQPIDSSQNSDINKLNTFKKPIQSKMTDSSHTNSTKKNIKTFTMCIKEVSAASSLLKKSSLRRYRQLQGRIVSMIYQGIQKKNTSVQNSTLKNSSIISVTPSLKNNKQSTFYQRQKKKNTMQLSSLNATNFFQSNISKTVPQYENFTYQPQVLTWKLLSGIKTQKDCSRTQSQTKNKENIFCQGNDIQVLQSFYLGEKKHWKLTERKNRIIVPLPYFQGTINLSKLVNRMPRKSKTLKTENKHLSMGIRRQKMTV